MATHEQELFPALFISHGAAAEAMAEDPFIDSLRELGVRLPQPRAILIISGHWWEPGASLVTTAQRPPTIHDFGGYPPEFYRLRYPATGDPELARRIVEMLRAGGEEADVDDERGFDHGVWVPLRALYPRADIPVVQLSIPAMRSPRELAAIGAMLRPLRREQVLIIGSGGAVHNLARRSFNKEAPVMEWARKFNEWLKGRLVATDSDAILDYGQKGPNALMAVPTPDHFDPIFYVLGVTEPGERYKTFYEDIYYGSISMLGFIVEPRASA